MSEVLRIASLVFNQPLLVLPETAALVADVIEKRMAGEDLSDPQASRFVGRPSGPRTEDGRTIPMWRLEGSTAIVPVLGELVNRGAWVGASSGLVSYEGLQASLRAAAEDDRVSAIVLDMNSPGGEARGAMETGRLVRDISAQKPVTAFINSAAASAAYAIAAGASKIVTTETGMVGSIGVVVMLRDVTAAMEKSGVRTTLIYAGAHKVDGNPFSALEEEARLRIQGKVDEIYSKFTSFVAEMRGMSDKAVRATEASTYMGEAGVSAGLADSVGTLESVLAGLQSRLPAGSSLYRGPTMTDKTPGAGETDMVSRADHEAALSAAKADNFKAGAVAERARIAAILDSDEAKGREALARHYAFKTDDAADKALAALAAGPKVEASRSRLDLIAPDHNVGADAVHAADPESAEAIAASWDAAHAATRRR